MTQQEIDDLLDWDDEAPKGPFEIETYDQWEEKRRAKGRAVEIVRRQGRQGSFLLLALLFFLGCSPDAAPPPKSTPPPRPVAHADEIILDPSGEVVFGALVGGAWPTPFGIKVSPSTGGSWTSHDSSPWFDTSPHNSGAAGTECILKPHTEALSAGVHSQPITFRSAGLPDKTTIVSVVMLANAPSPSLTPIPPTPTPRPSIGPGPSPSPGKVTPKPTRPPTAATVPPEPPTPAGTVILSWMPATQPPGELPTFGYRVYWGAASAAYTQKKDVGLTTVASIVSPGTAFFAVTAYNVLDMESIYSNEVRHP